LNIIFFNTSSFFIATDGADFFQIDITTEVPLIPLNTSAFLAIIALSRLQNHNNTGPAAKSS
jgi:hypothetical protein